MSTFGACACSWKEASVNLRKLSTWCSKGYYQCGAAPAFGEVRTLSGFFASELGSALLWSLTFVMVILLCMFTAQLTCHLEKKSFHGDHCLSWHSTSPFKCPGDIPMVLKPNILEKSSALPTNSSTVRPQKANKQGRSLWEEMVINTIVSFLIIIPSAW